jgi:hypothetical protein
MFLWIGCLGSLFFPVFFFTGLTGTMWDQTTAATGQSAAWIQFLVHFGKYPFLVAWFSAYVAYAFIGFGLWKLRNWSRKAVIGISILGIALSPCVAPFVSKEVPLPLVFSTLLWLVIPFGWLIWYLRRPRVRFAFGAMPSTLGAEPPTGMSSRDKLFTATAAIATFALLVGTLFFALEEEMHHSGVYALTLSEAEHSPCVTSRIGGPLTPGLLVSGDMEESNLKGSAHLSIPVSGQKGNGTLVVSAEKQDGAWRIEELALIQKGHETQLLPSPMTCQ